MDLAITGLAAKALPLLVVRDLATLPFPLRHAILDFLDERTRAALATTGRIFYYDTRKVACPAHGSSWRFLDGMYGMRSGSRRVRWGCWDRKDQDLLHMALDRYDRFLRHLPTLPQGADRPPSISIPRVIHHIWLGSPPPPSLQQLRQTWIDQHPGWRHILWDDQAAEAFLPTMVNRDAFREAPNYGEKSDILRYEVLFQQGGVYVDADMECIAPLEDLHCPTSIGFYTGFSNTGTIELNNGLIGSKPGHPILEQLVQRIKTGHRDSRRREGGSGDLPDIGGIMKAVGVGGSQGRNPLAAFLGETELSMAKLAISRGHATKSAMSTIERTGPGLFTRVILQQLRQEQKEDKGQRHQDQLLLLLLPCSWFYPVPNNVPGMATDNLQASHQIMAPYIMDGVTRAVHYWAKSWQQQPKGR